MRRAEVASLVARASSSFIYDNVENDEDSDDGKMVLTLTQEEKEWFFGDQKTIVLGVKSENALRDVLDAAEFRGLTVSTVSQPVGEDKEHTVVCVAIGPHDDESIDDVTGNLKLM